MITALSGMLQLIATGWELDLLDAESSPASRHFFTIVGMFMVLFGGTLVHAVHRPEARRVVLLWAAL